MIEHVDTHNTILALVLADHVDAGAEMVLQIEVACDSTCDLCGAVVQVVDQSTTVLTESRLVVFDGTMYKTDEFKLNAPAEPGECTWTANFPKQEIDGVVYESGSTSRSFVVTPHATSIAVWDISSPVILDTDFKIKVGVKCALGCSLAGQPIAVHDQKGTEVATGTLSPAPYSETIDLYWAEVGLKAPASIGMYKFQVRLPKPDLIPAHDVASFAFGFSVVGKPEHAVMVEVVNRDTNAPVVNARVTLRPYGGRTDSNGVTNLTAAAGDYVLFVTKGEYDNFRMNVTVTGDTTVRAELSPARFVEDYRGNMWKVEKKTR